MSYTYLKDDVKEMRKRYEDIECKNYPQHLNKAVTGRVYPKDCYTRAVKFILKFYNPSYKLVHGIFMDHYAPLVPDEVARNVMGHAWIEIEPGIIFDGVFNRFYFEKEYLDRRNIKKYKEWTAEQVLTIATLRCNFIQIEAEAVTQYKLSD